MASGGQRFRIEFGGQGERAFATRCRHNRTVLMLLQCRIRSSSTSARMLYELSTSSRASLQWLTHSTSLSISSRARSGSETFGSPLRPSKGPACRIASGLSSIALAVILDRKTLCEPFGQMPSHPAVKMRQGLLPRLLAQTVPVERRLAADMQALEPALKQQQAGLQGQGIIRTRKHPPRKTSEPASAYVVHGQVSRNAQGRQILGGYWSARLQLTVEPSFSLLLSIVVTHRFMHSFQTDVNLTNFQ